MTTTDKLKTLVMRIKDRIRAAKETERICGNINQSMASDARYRVQMLTEILEAIGEKP